jgi:hypothetical protein
VKKKRRDWEKEGDDAERPKRGKKKRERLGERGRLGGEREREKNMRMRDLIGREENGQLCGEENEKIEDLRVRDKMKR